jgi:hypothetical protein
MFDVELERSQVEITLRRFLVNLGGILLKALVIISVASMVGVERRRLSRCWVPQAWQWG